MEKDFLYLHKLGRALVPKKFRPKLREFFQKAGHNEIPYKIFGIVFIVSFFLAYFIYIPFIFPKLTKLNPIVLFIITFIVWILVQGFISSILSLFLYFHYDIEIYKRTRELEEHLGDYLNLVAVNLKGGLSFENALWTAIKPEFGVLAKEITIVSKSVMTGNDANKALYDLAMKYDSTVLRRAVDLLVGEVTGGGKIVDVIDSLVANLRKSSRLKNELRVATTTYMIFISAIVIVIAPALFAVSFQLLIMITGFSSNLSGNLQVSGLPFAFGGSSVSPKEFKNFSYFAIAIIASFSSMIVSIIEKGDIKGGLKYIPVFVVSATMLYTIFSWIMLKVFSGINLG